MNQSCKVSEHNIETEEFKKEKKKKNTWENIQLKKSECNDEPPATKVAMHYKEQDENKTTIQRKLNKKIYMQRRCTNPEYKDLEKKAMKLKCSEPAYKQHEWMMFICQLLTLMISIPTPEDEQKIKI